MSKSWSLILNQNPGWIGLSREIRACRSVHAYLFECGGLHAGAFLGRSMAALLNCAILRERPDRAIPCFECQVCTQCIRSSFPGLLEIWPLGAAISITQARSIIADSTVRYAGNIRKVIVVHGADRMNTEAANALLKVIEEPASDIVMVLTASNSEGVLATIRSRCQVRKLTSLDPGPGASQAPGQEWTPYLRRVREMAEFNPAVQDPGNHGKGSDLLLLDDLMSPEGSSAAELEETLSKWSDSAKRRKSASPVQLTPTLDSIVGPRYVAGLFRFLCQRAPEVATSQDRVAALELSQSLSLLHDRVLKAAAREASKITAQLKETYKASVKHPLLSDEKRYVLLVGQTHARLLLRILQTVLRFAFEFSLEAGALTKAPHGLAPCEAREIARLSAVGQIRLPRIARRIDSLTRYVRANVGIDYILDEAMLILGDPAEQLGIPTSFMTALADEERPPSMRG